MKIAFVWDWPVELVPYLQWQDGLAAALVELRNRGHDVEVIVPRSAGDPDHLQTPLHRIRCSTDIAKYIKAQKPDVILVWGDMTRPNIRPLSELKIPLAICFAGGAVIHENTPVFDHIFVESAVYQAELKDHGYENVSIAFGTNTDLFAPVTGQPKLFDVIFPGTFALWKRHDIYAPAARGLKALAVGYMYDDHEQECWQVCLDNGVAVLPYTGAPVVRYLYAMSKLCVITSSSRGGSQRTVLEAMALNLPVIVTDSDKFDFAGERIHYAQANPTELRSYIDTLLNNPVAETRDFVLNNWSQVQYCDALEKGLKEIAH